MDISSRLISDNDCFTSPQTTSSDHIGWDKSHSQQVSENVAFQVKEVVKFQTRKVAESSGYYRIAKEAAKSNHQVKFLPHSDIELGSLLGQGGFNQVFELKSITRQNECFLDPSHPDYRYVVKVLRPDIAKDSWLFALCACDIVNEALLMAALDHPHILKIRAVTEGGIAAFEHGRSTDAFFMVMRKLDETLDDRLQQSWKPQFQSIRSRPKDRATFFHERYKIVLAIADALAYIHSLRIIHRDLKPQNIGFDSQGTLRIFDFGSARLIPFSEDPDETFRLSHQAGTLRYISPENYRGEPYNLKSDVYSFCILMHEILSLQTPKACFVEDKKGRAIWSPHLRPKIPLFWPKTIRHLLKQGMAQHSFKRPTMQEMHGILRKELDQQ